MTGLPAGGKNSGKKGIESPGFPDILTNTSTHIHQASATEKGPPLPPDTLPGQG